GVDERVEALVSLAHRADCYQVERIGSGRRCARGCERLRWQLYRGVAGRRTTSAVWIPALERVPGDIRNADGPFAVARCRRREHTSDARAEATAADASECFKRISDEFNRVRAS